MFLIQICNHHRQCIDNFILGSFILPLIQKLILHVYSISHLVLHMHVCTCSKLIMTVLPAYM